VVRAILTFGRRGTDELSLRRARPSEGIESLLFILGHRLRQGYEILRDYRWDEPFGCYPDLLDQAVANLLINALDAMPDGGQVHIVIDRDGDEVIICVRDHGPGIPAAERERIFTPFFTTKSPGEGTGLGLAIAREIASLHRGSLNIDSGVRDGAAFELRLPYLQALDAHATEPSPSPTAEGSL